MRRILLGLSLLAAGCATAPSLPHERVKLDAMPSADDILGGCAIGREGRAETYTCGDVVIESYPTPSSQHLLPELSRYGGDRARHDMLDVDAGAGNVFAIERMISGPLVERMVLYELHVRPTGLLRCRGAPTKAVEAQCLQSLAAFARGLRVDDTPLSASSLPPPSPLPETCRVGEVDGVGTAQCPTATLAWRVVPLSGDADLQAADADASILRGQSDVSLEGPFACTLAGQTARCSLAAFQGGAVLNATATLEARRYLVTCTWAGTSHDVAFDCSHLVHLSR